MYDRDSGCRLSGLDSETGGHIIFDCALTDKKLFGAQTLAELSQGVIISGLLILLYVQKTLRSRGAVSGDVMTFLKLFTKPKPLVFRILLNC